MDLYSMICPCSTSSDSLKTRIVLLGVFFYNCIDFKPAKRLAASMQLSSWGKALLPQHPVHWAGVAFQFLVVVREDAGDEVLQWISWSFVALCCLAHCVKNSLGCKVQVCGLLRIHGTGPSPGITSQT